MAFPPMLCDAKKTYAHIHYFILIALKFMEDLLDFFRAGDIMKSKKGGCL
jgi:hypothetical protein